ncbi:MAG TPA: GNAT family N-acetyltransferase [Aliidongia sp.]|uniref:GNAT family N-acetyltransferase n=1 Tax=Aliidongia sp. TaxID=1914230 RepID=UPI002DDC953A|nr:GNAT family N-acetyltransferase [Aliidongia sp.]HEV2673499.1 GNAT family N-acetyltransferase [Aliidongia sp.]
MTGGEIRILGTGDEDLLDRFLRQHADSSLFLRSNLRVAGLVDRGKPLQGTYAAAIRQGDIVAVAGHFWNENLILQAPELATELATAAVKASRRRIGGLIGPHEQVQAARRGLGLMGRATHIAEREILYALSLAQLCPSAPLLDGRVTCRNGRPDDAHLLTDWRALYGTETSGETETEAVRRRNRETIERYIARAEQWVLEEAGTLVAASTFNARLADTVQIGGVWTPPALRGRGYARAVVGGSLLTARATGTSRAVLFTPERNHAAQRAYESLGFRPIGDYCINIFVDD